MVEMVFVLGIFKRNPAAIARKPREPLVIEEVIVAAPKPREVRIKIICTSLCHSDINYWKLECHPVIFPRILGHEAIGVVESIGEGVHEVVEGDTVIPMFLPDCGECADCLSKKATYVRNTLSIVLHGWVEKKQADSQTSMEKLYTISCSFNEYTVVEIARVIKVDPAIPVNRVCLLSYGVSTGC